MRTTRRTPRRRTGSLYGLELDHEPIGDQKVEAALADMVALVADRDRNLAPKGDVSQSELDAQERS